MDKDYSHFLMEEYIKVIIKKIKNMAMVNFNGLIIENLKDYGKMESNMEWVFILDNMVLKNKESGKMEKG